MVMKKDTSTYTLLFQCRDTKGIVARISNYIFSRNANIISLDQHSTDPSGGDFFMRVEFFSEEEGLTKASLETDFVRIAEEFDARFDLHESSTPLRMGIMVSRPDHCLSDLLYLWRAGELKASIAFVAANCDSHRRLCAEYGIPFHFIPSTKDDRREEEFLSLAKGSTDFLVLARYMLVLSREFLSSYGKDIINIHHGFLPSFKGANPYCQAFEKGVKVIGATAHFVTEALDDGPIITQAVQEVSHKDTLSDLLRKGKNLEKKALREALQSYTDHRVIKYRDKTIVF